MIIVYSLVKLNEQFVLFCVGAKKEMILILIIRALTLNEKVSI